MGSRVAGLAGRPAGGRPDWPAWPENESGLFTFLQLRENDSFPTAPRGTIDFFLKIERISEQGRYSKLHLFVQVCDSDRSKVCLVIH